MQKEATPELGGFMRTSLSGPKFARGENFDRRRQGCASRSADFCGAFDLEKEATQLYFFTAWLQENSLLRR
jgi:hypothetical protein